MVDNARFVHVFTKKRIERRSVMRKTIMIIGGGLLQVPVIQAAKKMGLQVIVTDYNPNTMGMKYADIPIIMSTRDVDGSVRVAKAQNEHTPISGVLTVGTDASMTVAAVANALKLPGIKYEDAEAATNKIKMRTRFKENNVPQPNFVPVWSLADAKKACAAIGFPVVMKPADNMGARGVMRLTSKTEIADAFQFAKSASPSGEIIVEEYMEGAELSIDAVIYNNEIIFTGIADRIIERLPYFIETGHTMPSQLPREVQDEAYRVMSLGIRALGINHGYAKGDIKVTPEGVKIGELAARLSGGFMSAYTYPLSTGVDLMKAAVEIALGQEPGNLEPVMHRVAIERAIITKPGMVKKIHGLEDALKVDGIEEIFLNVKPGDMLAEPKSNVEKAGHIIASGNTLAEAEEAVANCRKVFSIEITEESEITMDSIRFAAREKFKKVCYVCKSCDGKDCASSVPGMGGTGTGTTFRQNAEALKEIKIRTRVIHDVAVPDSRISFFGNVLSMPVMAAPITGTVTNMAGAIDELAYNQAVVKGCMDAGTIAFVGDGATPEKYKIALQAISENHGMGIPIFKPRANNDEIITRIHAAEKAHAAAVGMDIDAVVFKTMEMRNQAVGPKGILSLREIVASTKLPFILKGIMDPRDAAMAVEAGAHAIVVSNHGGRVLEDMMGTIEVLEDIVREVQGHVRILIDGGFRTGGDILKALALGADGVLVGRPVAIAAVGMGEKGVSFYMKSLQTELKKAMILTGCENIPAVSSECIHVQMKKEAMII